MDKIDEAIKIFKDGGIIIYPTDTAFGIGCRMDDQKAVSRLFELRKRPDTMAVPVLFDSIPRVEEYSLEIGEKVRELMVKYWPGALTIVINCKKDMVPSLVRGGGESLGVRVPNHEIPRALVSGGNIPLLGPSANFHGDETPYRLEDLNKDLIKKVDFVIEGKTLGVTASTVLDCTDEPWKILRQGGVVIE